jgi:hypothetical protein
MTCRLLELVLTAADDVDAEDVVNDRLEEVILIVVETHKTNKEY